MARPPSNATRWKERAEIDYLGPSALPIMIGKIATGEIDDTRDDGDTGLERLERTYGNRALPANGTPFFKSFMFKLFTCPFLG